MELLGTITIKWADDGSCLELTCGDDTVRIGDGEEFETIQEYFDSVDFINISSTSYTCEWFMENTEFDLLEEREYVIPATVKNEFEWNGKDYVGSNTSTGSDYYNYGYYSVDDNYTNSSSTRSGYIRTRNSRELAVSKSYSINGVANAKTIKNGDICDFSINITHYGMGELTGVPVNDYMTGSHSALAPVEGNENAVLITVDEDGNENIVKLPEAGLRIVTYYVTIYNSGNARLYLNDMIDTLPKGFTYRGMCAVTDYSSVSTGTSNFYSDTGYVKANNSSTANSSYLLTYRYKDGDSGRNVNNILAPVADVNNDSVEYMSAYVHYTGISTQDVNGDYQQKLKFSFSNEYGTYTKGNIGYDSEKGMCYLEKGQAVSFGYRCYVPEYQYTEDVANNRISMQYYDYNGAGFKKSEGVTVSGNYTNYASSTNDGGCDIWSDFEASTAGLEGEYTTDWLTSDVDLVRGSVIPGVTKQITSKITSQGEKEDCKTGLINSSDTAEWTMTFSNDGTEAISNYTITDTMQYPFYFTGDVSYKISSGYIPYNTSACSLLKGITFKDANGNEITQALDKYDKEAITVDFKTLSAYSNSSLTYGNSYSVKLGEENTCSFRTGNYAAIGPDIAYSSITAKVKFDIDENYNCILQITFDENSRSVLAIGPGISATMTVQTKLPQSEMPLNNFVNTVRFSPNMDYDADNVIHGAVIRDDSGEPLGIEASSMITISGAYATTSWKTITDDSDPDNNASSREVDNYIVLKWDDEQDWDENSEYPPCSSFTYGLSVQNLCNQQSISRMVIIDDLPEVGDHMSYGDDTSPRYSEFMVSLTEIAEERFSVWDETTQINRVADSSYFTEDELGYTIEFSTATEFTTEDWEGKDDTATEWLSLEEAAQMIEDGTLKINEIRSFRVIVKGGEGIAKDHTLTVKADARIYGKVSPGQIAWNNFGYRYAVPISDTSDLELSASSLNVGIMTATTPKIKKVINAGTGRDITAAELNASAEFIVYHSDAIEYENEQDLLKKLYEDKIDFTVVTLTPEQIDGGEYMSLDNPVAYAVEIDKDGNYFYTSTESKFPWTEGEKYTFTEINLPENVIFSTMQGSKLNEYTITYIRNGRYKISCVNVYDDYAITIRKTNAKDSSPLEGAGFARYGVITGTSGDPEYEELVRQMWSENVNAYIGAVKRIQELETDNESLHILSSVNYSRLESVKDSYEKFSAVQGTVEEITDASDIGQNFSQLYRVDNGDGTETVYYFIDFNMTDENGQITYPSEIEKNFAFLETVAPEGFVLTHRLNLSSRGNVSSGGTLYVDISNSYATELPMTGGSGMLYIILMGTALMLLSTIVVIVRIKKKGGSSA